MSENRILILDDEKSVRVSLLNCFEDEGFVVFGATNGLDALKIVKQNKVDIAIVDIRLPGIDGNEFIQNSNKIDKNVKYIVYTGSSDYTLPDYLELIGVRPEFVVIKPVNNLSVLVEKVKKLISLENDND